MDGVCDRLEAVKIAVKGLVMAEGGRAGERLIDSRPDYNIVRRSDISVGSQSVLFHVLQHCSLSLTTCSLLQTHGIVGIAQLISGVERSRSWTRDAAHVQNKV